MQLKSKKLIILGTSSFAEIAYDYFDQDSEYSVEAFCVEKKYKKEKSFKGKEIVPLEILEKEFDPKSQFVFVAVVYSQLNRLRTRLLMDAKNKGFRAASYISKNCHLSNSSKLGEHHFIFENNTIQPFVKIGDNVIIWSGNHIGHHTLIKDNCFISSQAVISGHCEIGRYSFIGVNSTISNDIKIGDDNWIGPGSLISQNTASGSIYRASKAELSKISSLRMFKVNN